MILCHMAKEVKTKQYWSITKYLQKEFDVLELIVDNSEAKWEYRKRLSKLKIPGNIEEKQRDVKI